MKAEILLILVRSWILGGELVFAGDFKELKNADTLTSKYLTGRLEIEVPKTRKPKEFIKIKGARQNNLKILM
jgi:excinuclease ABC subunit A